MIPFLGAIGAGISGLAGGAVSLAGGAIQTIAGGAGSLVGAGGSIIGGAKALFGTPAVMGTTEAGLPYIAEIAAPGLFDKLSFDTLANVASLGYSVYTTQEQMKLAEKAIEAQRRAGYVVGAPGATTLAPTTSITMPAPGQPPGLLQTEDGAKLIKYGAVILIGYFLMKGLK